MYVHIHICMYAYMHIYLRRSPNDLVLLNIYLNIHMYAAKAFVRKRLSLK